MPRLSPSSIISDMLCSSKHFFVPFMKLVRNIILVHQQSMVSFTSMSVSAKLIFETQKERKSSNRETVIKIETRTDVETSRGDFLKYTFDGSVEWGQLNRRGVIPMQPNFKTCLKQQTKQFGFALCPILLVYCFVVCFNRYYMHFYLSNRQIIVHVGYAFSKFIF